MREELLVTGLQGRYMFTFVTSIGILVPVVVAVIGVAYSGAPPTADLPGIGSISIDPLKASLWFGALWIAIVRQLHKRATSELGGSVSGSGRLVSEAD